MKELNNERLSIGENISNRFRSNVDMLSSVSRKFILKEYEYDRLEVYINNTGVYLFSSIYIQKEGNKTVNKMEHKLMLLEKERELNRLLREGISDYTASELNSIIYEILIWSKSFGLNM